MKTLLIDDMRDIKADVIARNYKEGIHALQNSGPFDILYLDHDLASYEGDREKTGYDVMCFLEANPELKPGKIMIVSSNPVGRKRMQVVIDKLYGDVQ